MGKRQESTYLRPSQIRFAHDTVAPVFRYNNAVSIKDTFFQLYNREISWADIELMRVVWHNGQYVTLSNRRLAVYRLLQMYGKKIGGHEVKVEVQIVTAPHDFLTVKYSTPCNGEYTYIRGTDYRIATSRDQTTFDPWQHKLSKKFEPHWWHSD